ncbi:Hypothetical predicted protein [Pelobates cultripes]|uniref:Uncharacterized protein n=1 Tax=Pelobates cultripes TaxID=61616 RepID=A0AAD1QY21_PELCU|nr:Hypothetical predicted protein [Pelobates cultripes]
MWRNRLTTSQWHTTAWQTSLEAQKPKVADLEDRSRRNNLRFRGIPESVQNTDLNKYLTDLFQELTPSTHPDLLVIDRAHCLPRPNHLPSTTARDVIAHIHFYHVKERITKACRNTALPEPYSSIKIFADLSATTLQFRKSLAQVTTTLRSNDIGYRWGYPAKLLIQNQGVIHAVVTEAEGLRKLQDWGIPIPSSQASSQAKVPRLTQDWTQA